MAAEPPRARRARASAPAGRASDLRARVLVALPALVIVLAFVRAGGLAFALFVAALGLVCLHELYTMLGAVRPVKLAGFLGLLGLVLAARYGDQFQMLIVLVALLPVLFALIVLRPGRQDATLAMAVTLLGVWWIGLAVGHAVLLRDLPHGNSVLVDVLVGTFVGDTGAYFGGRALGRRPLAPTISPNKTLEGWLIGVACGTLGVWIAGFYQDWLSGVQALVLGAAVAVVAPIGDLFESLIKRDVGVKDSGRLFGAHGGALDRLDAVLFSVVAGYYVWRTILAG